MTEKNTIKFKGEVRFQIKQGKFYIFDICLNNFETIKKAFPDNYMESKGGHTQWLKFGETFLFKK